METSIWDELAETFSGCRVTREVLNIEFKYPQDNKIV